MMNIDDFREQLQMKKEQHIGVSSRKKYVCFLKDYKLHTLKSNCNVQERKEPTPVVTI